MDSRRTKIVVSLWHIICGLFTAMDIRDYPHLEDIEEFLKDAVSAHTWDLKGHNLYRYEWTDYERNPRSGGSVGLMICWVSRDRINEETRLIALAELYMTRSRYLTTKENDD